MARIPTYALDTNIEDDDLLLGTDGSTTDLITKNFKLSDIATYIQNKIPGGTGNVSGQGTINSIPYWDTANSIATVPAGTVITGKSFTLSVDPTLSTIKLGAIDSTFDVLTEGLFVYPKSTHYLTRVLPWLEIIAYEDPALQSPNMFDSAYDGSALVVGKSNTVGSANSSNLGIVGFNNTLTGDKMMIVGQGNDIKGANVGSLIVGSNNNGLESAGELKNSIIVGQSNDSANKIEHTAIIGLNIGTGLGTITNGLYTGSQHSTISGSNSAVIGGTSAALTSSDKSVIIGGTGNGMQSPVNSVLLGGTNNQFDGNNGVLMGFGNSYEHQGNSFGTFIAGHNNQWTNTAQLQGCGVFGKQNGYDGELVTFRSVIAGQRNEIPVRDCIVFGDFNVAGNNTDFTFQPENSLIGGFKNEMHDIKQSLIIGSENKGNHTDSLASGESNTMNTVRSIVGGHTNLSLGSEATIRDSLVVGSDNDFNATGDVFRESIIGGTFNDFTGAINAILTVGAENEIAGGNYHIIGGYQNEVSSGKESSIIAGNNNSLLANESLVVGKRNTVRVDESIVGGDNNTVGDTNEDAQKARNLIMGNNNSTFNSTNIVVVGNSMQSGDNRGAPKNVTNSAAFGQTNSLATNASSPSSNSLLFAIGRQNSVMGTLAFGIGGSNQVHANSAGNCIAIGKSNIIGNTSDLAFSSITIGQNNQITGIPSPQRPADYIDNKILIGKGLKPVDTGGEDYVLIGRNNDRGNDYDHTGMHCSLIVGASSMGTDSAKRNAIVVENKTNNSNESNVILPGVGKYRDYTSDTDAANGGVPLYGLYHNNGELRIRIN